MYCLILTIVFCFSTRVCYKRLLKKIYKKLKRLLGLWQGLLYLITMFFYITLERAESWFQLPYLANMRYQYYANGTLLIYPGIGQLAIGCRVSHPYKPSLVVPHQEHIYGKFTGGKDFGQPREEHSGVYVCQRLGGTFQHSLDIQVRGKFHH